LSFILVFPDGTYYNRAIMMEAACVSITGYTVDCFCKGESPLIN